MSHIMVKFWIIILAISMNAITEVVTSLPREDTINKHSVQRSKENSFTDVTITRLSMMDYFWLGVSIGILVSICFFLSCYCWCTTVPSGRRVYNIVVAYCNSFIRRLFRYEGHYAPMRREQADIEIAQGIVAA